MRSGLPSLWLPEIPFSGFRQCNIATLRSKLATISIRQGQVYREFVDHETGSTDDRTAFQAMFKDASQRKFDVLLFWALDRLSREGVLETLQHLNRLTSYGVGYRSFTEQYFDSCGIFRDAVIAIIVTVARACSHFPPGAGRSRSGSRQGQADRPTSTHSAIVGDTDCHRGLLCQ